MASLFSADKRIIWVRRIRQFWEEYRSKKIGMLGLALLILYVSVAIFAPWLSPYDPIAQPRLAQSYAMPQWVTIFPQFSDLATTQRIDLSWEATQDLEFVKGWGRAALVQYKPMELQVTRVVLSSTFSVTTKAPNEFFVKFRYDAANLTEVEFSIGLTLTAPDGEQYLFWKSPMFTHDVAEDVTRDSKDPLVIDLLGFQAIENIGNIIFSEKGDYTFDLLLHLNPLSNDATAEITISGGHIALLGQVHGILGADYLAKDIFTQVVHGARLSLAIGLLAAVVGTSIGIFVGVASGYLGGVVDEVSMRTVDILLCLPLLPLLLALVHLYGRNVYYIVLFIAVFGWQGLSRVIRSQTLSIRETAYIETAKASGAGGFYIMLRHIVPNIIPVAFASMVLAVPGAILFESALSFLGFGDPRVPTWGKMLQNSFLFGGFGNLAWYWIIPPGLAIIGICLAFVFIGFAFDEIVNPRLRRRR